MSGAKRATLWNVDVKGVEQRAAAGKGPAPPAYKPHPAATLPGFGGCAARGVAVVSCEDTVLDTVAVDSVKSRRADGAGVDLIGRNGSLSSFDLRVSRTAGAEADAGGPTPAANARPLRVRRRPTKRQFMGRCPAIIRDPGA